MPDSVLSSSHVLTLNDAHTNSMKEVLLLSLIQRLGTWGLWDKTNAQGLFLYCSSLYWYVFQSGRLTGRSYSPCMLENNMSSGAIYCMKRLAIQYINIFIDKWVYFTLLCNGVCLTNINFPGGLRTESSVSDGWFILLEGAHDQLDTPVVSAVAAEETCSWKSSCFANCSFFFFFKGRARGIWRFLWVELEL